MLTIRRTPVLLLAAFGALACSSGGDGGSTGPKNPSVTGHWVFTDPKLAAFANPRADLTLSEDADGAVSGNGSVYAESEHTNATAVGTHNHPAVTLTIQIINCTVSFAGQFTDANTVSGTAVPQGKSGWCPDNGTWTLKRQ